MNPQKCCASDPLIKSELERELKKRSDEIPDEENLRKISRILFGLSHPLRLKLALLLLKNDYCVCELVQMTRKKQNLVSHHLTILKKSGVLDSYMKSRWKYYRINRDADHLLRGIKE